MNKAIRASMGLRGLVSVPPDKSITHRALLLSALAKGTSTILNPLWADDCLSTAHCLKSLGVAVRLKRKVWVIEGRGLFSFVAPDVPLDCGNSGTTMRLLSGVMAGQPFDSILTGDASLSKRPMDRVANPLKAMGATVALKDSSFAPMKIFGGVSLKGIRWKNKVSSAQVKSCVLLAGLHAQTPTVYEEPSLSRDHTERMLRAMGARLILKGNTIHLKPGAVLKPQQWVVPGDFSSAAFFLVAALLVPNSLLRLTNVNLNPTRTGLLDILKSMGARIRVKKQIVGGEPLGDIEVSMSGALRPVRLNEKKVPHLIDEIPILAVLATQAHGRSVLAGIGDLRVKETDRIAAMAKNLKKLGAHVQEKKDALIIDGPTPLHGATVSSFDDHRIAMSMAVAGLVANGVTTIENAQCVAISFPTFWTVLKSL